MKKYAVLFVCMGNICRSPTAEAVFRQALVTHGLAQQVEVDSAGTDAYHVGEAPDRRAQQVALRRGYDLTRIRSRRIAPQDFSRFDLVLAMDWRVMTALKRVCPAGDEGSIESYMAYASAGAPDEVPDPYYGGNDGFERVLDMIEDATAGLIAATREKLAAPSK